VQREFILTQRGIDEREQPLFAFERGQVCGELVARAPIERYDVLETQLRDGRDIGRGARWQPRRFRVIDLQDPQRLAEHRQCRREFRDPRGAVAFVGREARKDHQRHTPEQRALEHGKGTTCASGIRALPPQAVGTPAHVVRIFDHFRDQRVVFREQEIAARPERIAMRIVDRQGENFWSAAHEATRQRREQRSWSFMGGRRVCHTWPQD